ncbi:MULTISPECIES: DUF3540 domain-containing protein [Burkholderia]|uniref:DUF3540 domain-containing protein n=1 Tax=Burkholderia TaxID=32008 RepID=UPI000ABEF85F|nr:MULTISPECIES: DUF3540 domain-containing protein [unclassified Burkholderia]
MTVLHSLPVRETRILNQDDELPGTVASLLRRPAQTGFSEPMTIGRVREPADGAWWIVTESGEPVLASVAVSCIVKPQPDDLVQLYRASGRCWVLAILERRVEARDIALDFGSAHVQLHAHDIEVQARDRLHLESAHLASRASVVTQAAAERHANVSGTDTVHAGNSFVHADRHMSLHAKSACVKSESLLKMDAGQIHMG